MLSADARKQLRTRASGEGRQESRRRPYLAPHMMLRMGDRAWGPAGLCLGGVPRALTRMLRIKHYNTYSIHINLEPALV